jgi:hypothetical protein
MAGMTGAPLALQAQYMRDPRVALAQQLSKEATSTAPVQTPLQGLARSLQGLLGGYTQGKVQNDMSAATQALVRGLTPAQVPDEQQVAGRDVAGGGYGGAMQELSGLQNNPYAGQMVSQLALQQLASREALAAEARKMDAAKDLYAFQQGNKAAPDGYAKNADGSFSFIPGGPADPAVMAKTKAAGRDPLVPVSGVGLFDRDTKKPVPLGGVQGGTTEPKSGPLSATLRPSNPFSSLPAPSQGPAMAAEIRQGTDELAKERESLKVINDLDQAAKEFEQLMKVQETGGWARNLPFATSVEGWVDPEIATMNSIKDKITPAMRQGLPGAASDRDVAMFRGASFGPEKLPQTNKNIIAGFKVSAQNARDRLDFREAYLGKFGTLRGAESAWRSYLEANPIFDPAAKSGEFRLNDKRAGWREHFTPRGSEKSPADMTTDELKKALGAK